MKRIFFAITILSITFFYNCNSKLDEEKIKEQMAESYTQFLQDQGFKDIKISFNEMDSATENTIDSMILRNLLWDFKCLTAPPSEEQIEFDSIFNLEKYNQDTLIRCKKAIVEVRKKIKSNKTPKVLYRANFMTSCSKNDDFGTVCYYIDYFHVFFTTDSIEYVDRVEDYNLSKDDGY